MAPVPVQPVSPLSNDLLPQTPEAAAVHRDLRELAERYPPPVIAEVNADLTWLMDRLTGPELAPYRRSFVAVVGGTVLGSGPDPDRLRRDVARAHGLHPQRVRVEYVHDPDRIIEDPSDTYPI
jgi:hypothetical protein